MKKILKGFFVTIFSLILLISCGEPASKQALVKELENIKTTEKLVESNEKIALGMESLMKQFQYTIGKVDQKNDASTIELNIKAVDILPYMQEVFGQMLQETLKGNATEEQINKIVEDYFANLSKEKELKYVDKTIEVKMSKVDAKWNLDNKEEILDFIKGDLKNRLGLQQEQQQPVEQKEESK